MESDVRKDQATEGMPAMTMAAWPRPVQDSESDEDDVCFTADGDESLPKRNLDALFASTPTLPKKRSIANASVDGDDSGGEPRQLRAGCSVPGGATAAELALERTAQVRTFLQFLPRPTSLPRRAGTRPERIAQHIETLRR